MPSKRRSQKPEDLSELARQANEVYERFLAFLKLASGFTLAVAVCDLSTLRDQLISRALSDAKKFGLTVHSVNISKVYERDFVAAVRSQLKADKGTTHIAVLVTGIDPLVYRPDEGSAQEAGASRPPFVARLNFDRERISQELPFPVVLWLEKEAFALLLREAPDLTQWISARFDFGGVSNTGLHFFEALLSVSRILPTQPERPNLPAVPSEESLLDALQAMPDASAGGPLMKRLLILGLRAQKEELKSDYVGAVKSLQEALGLSRQLDRSAMEEQILFSLGGLEAKLGNREAAIRELQSALDTAKKNQDGNLAASALLELGKLHLAAQENDLAISRFEEARGLTASLGDKPKMLQSLINLGKSYGSAGKTEEGIHSMKTALAVAAELGDPRREAEILFQTAELLQDEPLKAVEYDKRCLSIAIRLGDRHLDALCSINMAKIYASSGEPRRATSYLEEFLARARGPGDEPLAAMVLGLMALVSATSGDAKTATSHLDQAISKARGAGDELAEGRALLLLGDLSKDIGEDGKAVEAATRALKIFRHRGSEPEAREAEELLARLKESQRSVASP